MRNTLSLKAGRLSSACLLACLLFPLCHAQKAGQEKTRAAKADAQQVSPQEASGLAVRVKSVESSAFRAYLNSHLATWLWRSADKSVPLRQIAVDTSVAGLNDLYEHEREIPAAPAALFYREMLNVVRQNNPEEAERLRQSKVLQAEGEANEAARAGASLPSALTSPGKPQTAPGGVGQAPKAIASGQIGRRHV